MSEAQPPGAQPASRLRRLLVSYGLMAAGLLASFGTAAAFAARYLYPRQGVRRRREIFLTPAADVLPGRGRLFTLPSGETALVADTGAELVALSNVCPHLGCKVHWEEAQRRFYCPCHGGEFDASGKATAGPPADEGTDLKRFTLKRVGENLFIEVEEIVRL